jgi:hypothetical protein
VYQIEAAFQSVKKYSNSVAGERNLATPKEHQLLAAPIITSTPTCHLPLADARRRTVCACAEACPQKGKAESQASRAHITRINGSDE